MTTLDSIQTQIQSLIDVQFPTTNAKIDDISKALNDRIDKISSDVAEHAERLYTLESHAATDNRCIQSMSREIERLKQDRLRNNLRITGIPSNAAENATKIVMKIINIIRTELLPTDFNAYKDRNKSSIIIAFNSYALKRCFIDAIREKREILVEEVLPDTRSNGKIYCNDQLTPFFAELFQKAWKEKKANKLFAVSSVGGRIRVRKCENSEYITIETEQQFNDIIDVDTPMDSSTTHNTNESPNASKTATRSAATHCEENRTIRNSTTKREPPNNIQHQSHNSGAHRSSQRQQFKGKPNAPNYQSKRRSLHHDNRRPVHISPGQYTSPRRGQRSYSSQPSNRYDNRHHQSYSRRDYYDRDDFEGYGNY